MLITEYYKVYLPNKFLTPHVNLQVDVVSVYLVYWDNEVLKLLGISCDCMVKFSQKSMFYFFWEKFKLNSS